MLYRNMDRRTLDAAYNNQAAVPAFAVTSAQRRQRGAALRHEFGARVDLAYGPEDRQKLDLFCSASPKSPLLVFVHGGYWQGGDKDGHDFIAAGALCHGFSVAVVEYTVAPHASLARMVSEVRAAIEWLRQRGDELKFDGTRLVLAGHSAGAQLICAALDMPGVIGGIAISGIFDLEPIRLCYLNDRIAMTQEDVELFSPIHHLPRTDIPLRVTVGAAELPELLRQSRTYATLAARHGAQVEYSALDGHDHFSILEELAAAQGVLCKQLPAMTFRR
jgi:arylformamidase